MEPVFEWSNSSLLFAFVLIAMVIPAVVLYFDDDTYHHLH